MTSYGKGVTTPLSGVRMCQRLSVGYRLELVARCIFFEIYMKVPSNSCCWRESRVFLGSSDTCCWGFNKIHAEHTCSIFSFLETHVLWFNYYASVVSG